MIVEISMILLMETYYKSTATDNSEGKTVIITIERSGSVVECLSRDRGAVGSSLTGVTAL